jgi:dTMP kinase
MGKGKLYVIEGLDGSGKATQAKALAAALSGQGSRVREITFPNYASPSSTLAKMYLQGDFGDKPEDVNAYAASSFYAVDRYASYKTDWGSFYQEGGILVADRYTTSNAVHQCAKLPEAQWSDFTDWLFHYEYDLLGLPAPDAVIYLSVAPEISQKLMTGRYHGDESQKDILEKDVAYAKASRRAAAYCAARLGWHTVECTADGHMRSVEEIHRDILAILEDGIEGKHFDQLSQYAACRP